MQIPTNECRCYSGKWPINDNHTDLMVITTRWFTSFLNIMDLFTVIRYTLLVVVIFASICYQLSQRFKASLYYIALLTATSVALLPAVRKPGDAESLRFALDILIYLTKWMNFKYEIRGYENLNSKESVIIVANHQSSLDIKTMATIWLKKCVVAMKKPLKYAGSFGLLSKLSGCIFLDQYDRNKAKASMDRCMGELKKKNTHLLVLPEGVRYRGEDSFQKRRFSCSCARKAGFFIIEIMAPISTKDLSGDDVTKLSENTRCQMIETWKRITAEAELRFSEGNI